MSMGVVPDDLAKIENRKSKIENRKADAGRDLCLSVFICVPFWGLGIFNRQSGPGTEGGHRLVAESENRKAESGP